MTTLTIGPDPAAPMSAEDQPEWALPLIEYLRQAAEAGEVVTVTSEVPMLTPAQVADRIGISRSSVSRRIKAGEIKVVKVGNRNRIPAPEFERFYQALMQEIVDYCADDIEADLLAD